MSRPLDDNLLCIARPGQANGVTYADSISNPLYDGADPWVICHGERYFSCNARSDGRIEVWQSHSPLERGLGRIVWAPPRRGWNSRQVWAPEIHHIHGRWYIYYAASDGRNANHRMGVL